MAKRVIKNNFANMYDLVAAGKPFERVVECSLLPQIRNLSLTCRELKLVLMGDGSGWFHRDPGRPQARGWIYRNVIMNCDFRDALVERAQGYPETLFETLFHYILEQHFGGHDVDFDRVFADKKRQSDRLIAGVSHERGRRLLPLCDLWRTNTRGGFGRSTGLTARDRREFTEVNVVVGDNTLRMYEGPPPGEIMLFGMNSYHTMTWDGTNNVMGACYGSQGRRQLPPGLRWYSWRAENSAVPSLPVPAIMRTIITAGPPTDVDGVNYPFSVIIAAGGHLTTPPHGEHPPATTERNCKHVYVWWTGHDRWLRLPDLQQGRSAHSIVDAWPDIYVLGGRTTFQHFNGIHRVSMTHTVEVLNMANPNATWKYTIGLPRPMASFSATCMNGHLVVFGGMTESNSGMFPRSLVDVFCRQVSGFGELCGSSWQKARPLLMPNHGHAMVKLNEREVVILGGYSFEAGIMDRPHLHAGPPLGTRLGVVYKYTLWKKDDHRPLCLDELGNRRSHLRVITELAFRRAYLCAGMIRGKLHVFGGGDAAGTVEIADEGGIRYAGHAMRCPGPSPFANNAMLVQLH